MRVLNTIEYSAFGIVNQIELLDELGEGGFGKVWKGQMDRNALAIIEAHPTETSSNKDKQGSNNSMIVAVKMLHEVASAQEQSEFLREIEFMKTVGFHKNIIAMVACCTKQEDQLSLVVEFAKHGDLLNLLKDKRNKTYIKCRPSSTNEPSTSNSSNSDVGYDTKQSLESLLEELIAFSWQIAQGMEYLSSKGIVHRDLAARNILVADGFIAKVADFGFSRQVNYQDKLYQAHGPRRLPLRWTSPEAIEYQIFTSESDVWSFGVVLWEIYSIGKLPYPSLYIDKLLRFIKKGNRMEKPDLCPDDMYKVMRICWNEHAEERPSFSAIIKKIEALMTKDTPYVEMIEMGEDEDGYTIPFDISDVESDVSDMV